MPKPIKKTVKDFCSRNAPLLLDKIDRAKTDAPIPTVVATEKPAVVIDWGRREIIHEVLLMSGAELPENRQVTLYDTHWIWGTESIMGSERNLRVEGSELLGDTHISSVAERQKILADEGHLTDVSAGYRPYKEHSVVIAPGKEEVVNGRTYKNDFNDGLNLIIRTKWLLTEVSLVPMGADDLAKFKREAADESDLEVVIRADDPELQKVINEAVQRSLSEQSKIKINGGSMKTPEEIAEERKRQAAEDMEKIFDFGEKRFSGKYKDLAARAVREKKTFDEFNNLVLDEMQKRGSDFETPHSFLDMPASDLKRYSVSELIDYRIRQQTGELKPGITGGVAMEAHNEIAKRIGAPQNGGVYLAHDFKRAIANIGKGERAHSAGVAGEGGYSVGTVLRDDLLVEDRKNSLALGQLGATVIAGLRENFTIPKILTGLQVFSVAENAAAAKSFVTLGQLSASPKNISGYTEYGRQLFYQSSLSFDQLLMKQLNDALNVKIDYLGINGLGSGNEPLGLLNQTGPTPITLGAPSWTKVLGFRKVVKKSNADKGVFNWGMSVDAETKFMSVEKSAGNPIYLMNEDGKMAGVNSISSNQFPDQVTIYGNWSQLYLLFWGNTELLINPFAQGSKGIIEINVFEMMDVLLRESDTFAIAEDTTII